MSFENFTVKSQEAIQKAVEIATSKLNQAIEPVHLLKAMLQVDDNAVPYLLKAQNANVDYVSSQLDSLIDSLPKVTGGEHYLSPNSNKVIQKAQQYAQESQDKYVSIEQLLLSILSLNEGASRLLQNSGVTEKGLKEAIKQLRKGSTVNSQTTDETYNALNRFATNLNERAKTGKLDPVIGRDEEIRYGRIPEATKAIESLKQKLAEIQKDSPLINEEVDAEEIAEVVSHWTGIPVSRMLESEKQKLLNLETELHMRVVGQDEAIRAVSDAIRRSRAGLQDPKRPIGSFIFLGTTGVGKTELAKALADFLFNNENNMVRIDMSEYQERHTVSRLVGAPPGYVGYEESGQLTEAVRRKPYSVVLLDEIEKAHPDVFNILLQVLDDGRLTDNKGRTVDFKNTIIIMTSNIGSHIIQENLEKTTATNREEIWNRTKEQVFALLKQSVKPEFLNRVDEIIMFQPLTEAEVRKIVENQLKAVQKMLEKNGVKVEYTKRAVDYIAKVGFDPQFGARPVKRVIQKNVLNEMSKIILAEKVDRRSVIVVDEKNGALLFKNKP
ncbi:MAG TPA: AAA family ATPase [Candidatus Acidoferrales bacterium]|nr:AAA family ATPase [Candidatus Acidoferrales bacterium]